MMNWLIGSEVRVYYYYDKLKGESVCDVNKSDDVFRGHAYCGLGTKASMAKLVV